MGTGEGGVAVEMGEGEKEEKGGGGGERRPHREWEGWSQRLDSERGRGRERESWREDLSTARTRLSFETVTQAGRLARVISALFVPKWQCPTLSIGLHLSQ